MNIIGVLLIFLFAAHINAREAAEKNCGAELVEALQDICRGRYARMFFKRSVHPKFILPSMQSSQNYPYLPANSLANIFDLEKENYVENLRRTRWIGIVQECCKAACTIDQLKDFCE